MNITQQLALINMINCISISAQAEIISLPEKFTGEGEFGYNATAGNSDTSSLNAKIGLSYLLGDWEHNLNLSSLSAKNSGALTKERYLVDGQIAKTFSEVYYGFGNLRYDKDLFSGYEYQTNFSMGVGRRFWQTSKEVLNIELGIGYQIDKLQSAEEETQPIVRTALKLRYPINQQLSLSQDILLNYGSYNAHTESTSGLKIMMSEKLALKLSYTLKNNTHVLDGRDNLDTIGSLNLVYGF